MRALAIAAVAVAVISCTPKSSSNGNGNDSGNAIADAGGNVDAGRRTRARIDGSDFPDHVIALTWDDGPDSDTLELAKLLSKNDASATFFVVAEWNKELSEEPGEGINVFHTGHRALPILQQLVALGHRIGNHTAHHHLLTNAPRDLVRSELLDNQREIAPFQTNELPLFRAPGGYFDDAAATAIEDTNLVGPVHWDIDGKDWEGSLYPRDAHPSAEVVAERYLQAIERAGHGIVLLHDRVGNVGSTYALDVARLLVPNLVHAGSSSRRLCSTSLRLRPAACTPSPDPIASWAI